jgi:hypothetical protein
MPLTTVNTSGIKDATIDYNDINSGSFVAINDQSFTDITIPANKNVVMAGDITVTGTLTIPASSNLTII